MESVLKISSGGFPPLSARGCTQELIPVSDGIFKRTIEGKLCFIQGLKEIKFRTIISCEDKAAFALDTFSPAQEVEVNCLQELTQKVEAGAVTLIRDPVPNSLKATGLDSKPLTLTPSEGRIINVPQKGYVSFRPILKMRVTQFSLKTNEWGLKVGWSLHLEEV